MDLPAKIKIYPVQHIAILKPVYGNIEPSMYKIKTYKDQKENKWGIKKIINYKEVDEQLWYKIKWAGYTETT